jgi:GTP-binding protein
VASPSDFIDEVRLYLRAGHGGAGCLHFRREKFVPKGGPDGGDGGRGGDIIMKGNKKLSTLLSFKYSKHIVAENGKPGQSGCCTGADGLHKVLEVPLGTTVKGIPQDNLLLDVVQEGQQVILMQGGRGGLGNVHFKSPTHQTPRYAQAGEPGQEGWVKLELKLLAQVGLVGMPNAGKSTLLASLSAAKPSIADYPFTTLSPQLGVVPYRDRQSFVLADMPGLIEGAATGKGLGLRFLRHIERTLCLAFVIGADTPDVYQAYCMLVKELEAYDKVLLHKPRLLIISKADLIDAEQQAAIQQSLPASLVPIFVAATIGQGLDMLKDRMWHLLHQPLP